MFPPRSHEPGSGSVPTKTPSHPPVRIDSSALAVRLNGLRNPTGVTIYKLRHGRSRRVHLSARILIAMVLAAAIDVSAFAQTQPTRPSAYATIPTLPSAFATAPLSPCFPSRRYFDRGYFDFAHSRRLGYFNPESPCYSGTIYPSYSALGPFEFPKTYPKPSLPGSESLNDEEAKLRIEAKGYLDVHGLEKDRRGIWRGKATLKDGRSVDVTLDLEGNIYSELSRLFIRIQPPPSNR
jgi:hypothetical protein